MSASGSWVGGGRGGKEWRQTAGMQYVSVISTASDGKEEGVGCVYVCWGGGGQQCAAVMRTAVC